jgi:dihydropteroate synthase
LSKLISADRPAVMGILNVTPDSFSDGGRFLLRDEALRHADKMIQEGVDIIDIGGESTRPGANRVSAQEELDRVIPVLEAIRNGTDIALSIDTSTPRVMTEAASVGIEMINDVRALRRDGALTAARDTGLPICLMHMQGDPQTMQLNPNYIDLMSDIGQFFEERITACIAAGVDRELLILDPGFGFGKTPQQNLQLINELDRFAYLGRPLLVGLSRKSTISKVLASEGEDRLIGSLTGAVWAYLRGAAIIRVHDVEQTRMALTMAKALATNGKDLI